MLRLKPIILYSDSWRNEEHSMCPGNGLRLIDNWISLLGIYSKVSRWLHKTDLSRYPDSQHRSVPYVHLRIDLCRNPQYECLWRNIDTYYVTKPNIVWGAAEDSASISHGNNVETHENVVSGQLVNCKDQASTQGGLTYKSQLFELAR